MGFNAACDIHGVPDQGEFEPPFASNISLYDLAVVKTAVLLSTFKRGKSLRLREIPANQATKYDDADRSGVTFNFLPGNASLSMCPGARHACAMQFLILPARPPRQTDNTPRPFPMLLARCEYGLWPHESMEASLFYAWLVSARDQHGSAVHQDLA